MATLTKTVTILRELGVTASYEGDFVTLYLPELPEQTIVIKKSMLRRWCVNRIESRSAHVGRGYFYGGGGGKSNRYVESAERIG